MNYWDSVRACQNLVRQQAEASDRQKLKQLSEQQAGLVEDMERTESPKRRQRIGNQIQALGAQQRRVLADQARRRAQGF